MTEKLSSHKAAYREVIPEMIYSRQRDGNNRANQSHKATTVREQGMRRFKSMEQAQILFTAHAAVSNLFNLRRHLVRAKHYCDLRVSAIGEWDRILASGRVLILIGLDELICQYQDYDARASQLLDKWGARRQSLVVLHLGLNY